MKRLSAELRRPLFWILILVFSAGVFLHYVDFIAPRFPAASSYLGLDRHSIERLLFFDIIILAGAVHGWTAGLVFIVLSVFAMVPRLFLPIQYLPDSIYETSAILVACTGFNWWLETRRRELAQRENDVRRLQETRQELQAHVETIRASEKRLSVLHSLAAAINRFSNLTDILNTAVDVVMETVNPDGVLMYVLNRNAGILELREHRGVSAEFARSVEKLSISKDLKTSGAATGSPGGMEYTSNNLHLAGEAITKEGVLSQYVVPLVARDEVVGTICLLGRTQRTYAPEEKQLLALIGAELGVAAERAQLTEEKERAGMQFRQLFERAHDAIWMQDMGGKILASNQAAADYTGYRYGEGVGMNVAVFLTPEGLQLAREVRRKLLAGEDIQQPYEQKVIRKDGSFATIMLTTSLVRDETGRLIFQHISRDVTRERRLAENLRLYAQQITRAHEEERKRIARELHDDSMQALIILSRRADEVLSTLGKRSRAAAHAVEELRQEIDAVLARMRLFAQDLRPPTLEYLGLIPAARELVLQTEHQSGIATTILVEGEERHFSPEDELLIYRIIQEALNNVRKHAEARHATVFLRFGASQTTIQVKDDGRGFNAAENMGFVQAGKIGLAGMQERADLLGGSLTVESAPGRGATVTLMVPGERWRKLPATSN